MKYARKPSQIGTTLASYATAPRMRSRMAKTRSEQGEAAHGLADEVVEHVGRRPHDERRAGVAEDSLDPHLLAKRRAAAHPHRQVGDLRRRLAGRGLALEHAQRGVGAVVGD